MPPLSEIVTSYLPVVAENTKDIVVPLGIGMVNVKRLLAGIGSPLFRVATLVVDSCVLAKLNIPSLDEQKATSNHAISSYKSSVMVMGSKRLLLAVGSVSSNKSSLSKFLNSTVPV